MVASSGGITVSPWRTSALRQSGNPTTGGTGLALMLLRAVVGRPCRHAGRVLDVGSADGPSVGWLRTARRARRAGHRHPRAGTRRRLRLGAGPAVRRRQLRRGRSVRRRRALRAGERRPGRDRPGARAGRPAAGEVPAYQWAWTHFDEVERSPPALHPGAAVRAVEAQGLDVLRATYAFAAVFPFFSRGRLRRAAPGGAASGAGPSSHRARCRRCPRRHRACTGAHGRLCRVDARLLRPPRPAVRLVRRWSRPASRTMTGPCGRRPGAHIWCRSSCRSTGASETLAALCAETGAADRTFTTADGHRARVAEVLLVHDCGPDDSARVIRATRARPTPGAAGLAEPQLRPARRDAGRDGVLRRRLDGHAGRGRPARPRRHRPDARRRDAPSRRAWSTRARPTRRRTGRCATSPRGRAKRLVDWLIGGADARLLPQLPAGARRGRAQRRRVRRRRASTSTSRWAGSPAASRPARSSCAPRAGASRATRLRTLLSHFWRMVLTSGTRLLRLVSIARRGVRACSGFVLAISSWSDAARPTRCTVPGWTSLMVVVLLGTGAILFSLGVIAEYVGVAVNMAMGKPLYLITSDRRTDRSAADAAPSRGTGTEVTTLVVGVAGLLGGARRARSCGARRPRAHRPRCRGGTTPPRCGLCSTPPTRSPARHRLADGLVCRRRSRRDPGRGSGSRGGDLPRLRRRWPPGRRRAAVLRLLGRWACTPGRRPARRSPRTPRRAPLSPYGVAKLEHGRARAPVALDRGTRCWSAGSPTSTDPGRT